LSVVRGPLPAVSGQPPVVRCFVPHAEFLQRTTDDGQRTPSRTSTSPGPGGALPGFGTISFSDGAGRAASQRRHNSPAPNTKGPVAPGSEAYLEMRKRYSSVRSGRYRATSQDLPDAEEQSDNTRRQDRVRLPSRRRATHQEPGADCVPESEENRFR